MINFKMMCIISNVLFLAHFGDLFSKIQDGVPLYYWQSDKLVNFGDYLSLKLVERIVGKSVKVCSDQDKQKKLLAIGSILTKASNNDVVWGSGIKRFDRKDYKFNSLDIRAVRGPITRKFIIDTFNIPCPEVYGDPALLVPYLFPEFKKKKKPRYEYIIIPHYRKQDQFPQNKYKNIIYSTESWDRVIKKIVDSKFVISGSLHGLIVAEAYGIPARYLRVTDDEPLLKYQDYYYGTNRLKFQFATSVEEALRMGGESPFECDLQKLYAAFPSDLWANLELAKKLGEIRK